jgi:hypothetical protein
MPNKRLNTPTEQNKEDNGLLTYRVLQLELAVKDVSSKMDKQDYVKRSDITELKNTILERISEIQQSQQKQLDKLDEDKANAQDLNDFKKQVYGLGAFVGSLFIAAFSYMLTRLH